MRKSDYVLCTLAVIALSCLAIEPSHAQDNPTPVQGSGHVPAAATGLSLHHVQINGWSFWMDQGKYEYASAQDDGTYTTTFTSHGGVLTHTVITTFDEDEGNAAWKARVHAERVAAMTDAFAPDQKESKAK